MNKRIVVLLLAALILAFAVQTNAAFVVLSPVPDPSPTPIMATRILIDRNATPEPVSDYSKSSYHFEFRLDDLVNWDDVWEAVETWLEKRGW